MGNPVRQNKDVFMKDEGLLHEVAVTGRKYASPNELREFFSILAHNGLKFRRVMDTVLGRTDLMDAAKILGLSKIVGYQQALNAWNLKLSKHGDPIMPFSKETLKQCAKENLTGADWHVVWINGLSLRKQEKIRGRNKKKQPCFYPDWTWWLEKQQDVWANQSVIAGYRLFDFSGRFSNMYWQVQEDEIKKLGENYERAEEQAVTEACFTIYLVSGKKESLLTNWYHCGGLSPADGRHICVGCFNEGGFHVNDCWDADYNHGLKVVLSRKS